MGNYPKGSEWRRWDLHIHTPETNKNDKFTGASVEDKWEQFYSTISNYVGDGLDPMKAVTVIGITDYLSIDNYKKVLADKRLPDCVKLILPNVEMRIQPIAHDSPINIHFIFDPNIIEWVQDKFFSNLSFPYGKKHFSASRSQLVELGKEYDSSLDDKAAYLKGVEQFVVSFDSVKAIFDQESELRKHVLVAVSNQSNDGVSGATDHANYFEECGDSQLKMFRQSIYHFVDAVFSPKPSDLSYFLGKKETAPPSTVIQQCGSLKPCIHGCDAHTNTKVFEPDQKRYCWIKADPTFNGLKQIIFEPEERVRISETKPEIKPDYLVIDRVEFYDPDFQTEPIVFSDKLTCIIGGKSTGKSILLHNLALTLDKNQVEKKIEISQTRTKADVSMNVYWADGTGARENPKANPKIIYIPQTYLNRLCDAATERTEIDTIIQDIVLLNEDAKKSFDAANYAINAHKIALHKVLVDLESAHKNVQDKIELMKNIGDKLGIEGEKQKLFSEKERLTKESSLTEEEVKSYDEATSNSANFLREIQSIDGEISAIEAIASLVEPKQIEYRFSEQIQSGIETAQTAAIADADSRWETIKCEMIASLNASKIEKNEQLSNFKKVESSLKEKIQSNKAILELTEKIKIESENLAMLAKYDEAKQESEREKDKLLTEAIASVEFYEKQHKTFADAVNGNPNLKTEDLLFSVEVPFKADAFIEKMKEMMAIGSRVFKESVTPENFTAASYTPDYVRGLVKKVLSGELTLKKGYTPETVIRDILSDWFEVKYKVNMGNDSIDVMSPGKKALVLLKLLIDLAESKCPILIDQPEDDLDNRSVFDELIPFIKKKKKYRQIIVVTHNANVVLGADAEVVVVANQRGNNAPNRNFKFEYRSGSIENDIPATDVNGVIESGILNKQGIQQHICDILEGGETAFELRKQKYHI